MDTQQEEKTIDELLEEARQLKQDVQSQQTHLDNVIVALALDLAAMQARLEK